MLCVMPREQRPSAHHLRGDATDRPYVNGCGVVDPRAEHLWCPIPACAYILAHGAVAEVLVREAHTRQPEVADLQIAIRIHEEVPGLEVSVYDLSRMHVLHSP